MSPVLSTRTLTPEQRNERAAECWAWACAVGARRLELRSAYLIRWCGAEACPICERAIEPGHDCFAEAA